MTHTIFACRLPSGALAPLDDEAREMIAGLKIGDPVKIKISRPRNYKNHKRMFALFNLAFGIWEPSGETTYKGQPITKCPDRFRKDITILAGYYTATYRIDGSTRLEPESLSYSSMSEERFRDVYRSVLNVVWEKVFRDAGGYLSPEQVDATVENLMRFE